MLGSACLLSRQREPESWRAIAAKLARPVRDELPWVALCAVFSLLVRWLTLEEIETGGDAYQMWHFAKQWFYHLDLSSVPWDHHKARFGVIGPIILGQWIFGRHATAYHLVAVSTAVLQTVVVYLCGRTAHGRGVGLLATAWVVLFPSMIRSGSQLLPESFASIYALIAVLFLFAYARAARHQLALLVLSSAFLFVGYLAKETATFLVPGAMLATYLLGRNLAHVGVYAGVQFLGLGLETLWFRWLTPYSSRFAVIEASHLAGPPTVVSSFWDLFDRYTTLEPSWKLSLLAAAVATVVVPRLTEARRSRILLCFAPFFYLGLTFPIRRWSPLELFLSYQNRYLDLGLPFVALSGSLLVVHGLEGLRARGDALSERIASLARRGERWAFLGAVTAFTLLSGCVYSGTGPPRTMERTERRERVLTDTYRRDHPIVAVGRFPYRDLRAVYALYIDDRLLLKDGRLPDIETVKVDQDVLSRSGDTRRHERCRVRVRITGRGLQIDRQDPLPTRCH